MSKPEVEFEWKIPKWSDAIERDRARTYFQAYSAAAALYFAEQALAELHAGRTKTWNDFKVPEEAIGCGFHEAVRGVLSHHVVIRNHKIANYHPYPNPLERQSARQLRDSGPVRRRGAEYPIFEENGPENFKGIDIMRAVRSFDPCLPCGCTCIWGMARCSRPIILQCSECHILKRLSSGIDFVSLGAAFSFCDAQRRSGVASEKEFQEKMRQLGTLVGELDQMPGAGSKVATRELVQLLMEVHGAGLEPMVELLSEAGVEPGRPGSAIIHRFGQDPIVRSLLLLYGLHPDTRKPGFYRRLTL